MSAILRTTLASKESQEPPTHLELLINRMEDGFSKIYMQLEAMDERLQEVQGMGDKVDMLETSVRLLENNALGSWSLEQPPMDSPANMSLSSSSLHSVHTPVTSVASTSGGGRHPPRRNHTIGNIKYDCAAYKVSFNLEDNNNMISASDEAEDETFEDEETRGVRNRKRTPSSSSCKQTNKQTMMDSIDEAVTAGTISSISSNYVVPTIVRSKSFSNNFEYQPQSEPVTPVDHAGSGSQHAFPHHPSSSPPSRSRSLRLQQPPSHNNRSARFSWNNQDSPDTSLKDSKLRGSCTSLVSMDHAGGSGATTPTPTSMNGAAFDISARDLMQRPSTHHSGNLEMKKTSGFKSYKRYWAVLDSNFLYLYGKEKDSKAKQIIDVTGSNILELTETTSNNFNSANGNNAGTSNLSSAGSFRESLKKRGGRSFELVFNNGENRWFAAQTKDEAEEWMKKLKEASAFKLYEVHDHHERVAVEMAYEEEVVHEVASSDVQQEWRLAIKHHSRNPSRYR